MSVNNDFFIIHSHQNKINPTSKSWESNILSFSNKKQNSIFNSFCFMNHNHDKSNGYELAIFLISNEFHKCLKFFFDNENSNDILEYFSKMEYLLSQFYQSLHSQVIQNLNSYIDKYFICNSLIFNHLFKNSPNFLQLTTRVNGFFKEIDFLPRFPTIDQIIELTTSEYIEYLQDNPNFVNRSIYQEILQILKNLSVESLKDLEENDDQIYNEIKFRKLILRLFNWNELTPDQSNLRLNQRFNAKSSLSIMGLLSDKSQNRFHIPIMGTNDLSFVIYYWSSEHQKFMLELVHFDSKTSDQQKKNTNLLIGGSYGEDTKEILSFRFNFLSLKENPGICICICFSEQNQNRFQDNYQKLNDELNSTTIKLLNESNSLKLENKRIESLYSDIFTRLLNPVQIDEPIGIAYYFNLQIIQMNKLIENSEEKQNGPLKFEGVIQNLRLIILPEAKIYSGVEGYLFCVPIKENKFLIKCFKNDIVKHPEMSSLGEIIPRKFPVLYEIFKEIHNQLKEKCLYSLTSPEISYEIEPKVKKILGDILNSISIYDYGFSQTENGNKLFTTIRRYFDNTSYSMNKDEARQFFQERNRASPTTRHLWITLFLLQIHLIYSTRLKLDFEPESEFHIIHCDLTTPNILFTGVQMDEKVFNVPILIDYEGIGIMNHNKWWEKPFTYRLEHSVFFRSAPELFQSNPYDFFTPNTMLWYGYSAVFAFATGFGAFEYLKQYNSRNIQNLLKAASITQEWPPSEKNIQVPIHANMLTKIREAVKNWHPNGLKLFYSAFVERLEPIIFLNQLK